MENTESPTYLGIQDRKGGDLKNIWSNNDQNIFRLDESNRLPDPRSSINPKQKEHEENNPNAHLKEKKKNYGKPGLKRKS